MNRRGGEGQLTEPSPNVPAITVVGGMPTLKKISSWFPRPCVPAVGHLPFYTTAHNMERVRFIRQMQALGFSAKGDQRVKGPPRAKGGSVRRRQKKCGRKNLIPPVAKAQRLQSNSVLELLADLRIRRSRIEAPGSGTSLAACPGYWERPTSEKSKFFMFPGGVQVLQPAVQAASTSFVSESLWAEISEVPVHARPKGKQYAVPSLPTPRFASTATMWSRKRRSLLV